MSSTIWVTGASRGIGRAIAIGIAQMFMTEGRPVNLIINSRHDDDDLHSLEKLLKDAGASVLKLVGDVSLEADRIRMFDSIHASFKNLDVLISNAGISHIGLLQDMSEADISSIINVNLTGPISLCSMAIPDLLRSCMAPRIINISSVWGNTGASCEAVYSATKGGLNSFTKALAKELAPSHIPVNAIACGLIDTAMNSHLSEEELNCLYEEIPAGRAGMPEEVAQLVCMLLKAPDYLTGQIITLDGGWT